MSKSTIETLFAQACLLGKATKLNFLKNTIRQYLPGE